MPLYSDIAGVLEGKGSAQVEEDLGDRIVAEFIQQRTHNTPLKTVLLCESPHVDEICHRHVLAGATGQNVTTALRHIPNAPQNFPFIDSQDAVGCLLMHSTRHPVLDSLGIMNVSRLPLQKDPYCRRIRQDDDYGRLLCVFNKIRERAQTGPHELDFRWPTNADAPLRTVMEEAPEIIVRELSRRLRELPDNTLVIPCGHFARNFLRKAECEQRRQWSELLPRDLRSLPHPIRWPRTNRQWDNPPSYMPILLSLICNRATA